MSVILVILKILGIILLTVVGILLFLLFLLLFYPIGYRVEGHSEDKWKIHGSVYWLFHAVSYHFIYDGTAFHTQLKLFGIQKKQKKRVENDAGYEEDDGKEDGISEDAAEDTDKYIPIETPDIIEQPSSSTQPGGTVLFAATEDRDIQDRLPEEEKKTSSAKKTGESKKRKEPLPDKIRSKIRYFTDLFCNIKEKGKELKAFLTDESNRKAFSYIWKELVYLLKHMWFEKLKTELDFSAGDPARTGEVLGILSLMPFLYQYQVGVYPDFESEEIYISGSFLVKGHFKLLHLLLSIVRLLLHEECRRLMKRIMK